LGQGLVEISPILLPSQFQCIWKKKTGAHVNSFSLLRAQVCHEVIDLSLREEQDNEYKSNQLPLFLPFQTNKDYLVIKCDLNKDDIELIVRESCQMGWPSPTRISYRLCISWPGWAKIDLSIFSIYIYMNFKKKWTK